MEVVSRCPLRVASLLWQPRAGMWAFTFVCKATFVLQPGVAELCAQQEAPNEEDNYWDDDPTRSLYAPSDLVPMKVRADVLLVGQAFAPRGKPAMSVSTRLLLGGVDKSIEVFGDRAWTLEGQLRDGGRFVRMPLRYERAGGGPDTTNPVGMRPDAQDSYGAVAIPNLQPPGMQLSHRGEALQPIGYGPIAPTWPSRVEKLYRHAAAVLGGQPVDRPLLDGIDPRYFNAAPADQQVEALRANERIVLENLHPTHARLVTSLPGLAPHAVLERAGAPPEEVALTCDTLWIDNERLLCCLVWRGQVALSHPAQAGRLVVSTEPRARMPSIPPPLSEAPARPMTAPIDFEAEAARLPDMPFDSDATQASDPHDDGAATQQPGFQFDAEPTQPPISHFDAETTQPPISHFDAETTHAPSLTSKERVLPFVAGKEAAPAPPRPSAPPPPPFAPAPAPRPSTPAPPPLVRAPAAHAQGPAPPTSPWALGAPAGSGPAPPLARPAPSTAGPQAAPLTAAAPPRLTPHPGAQRAPMGGPSAPRPMSPSPRLNPGAPPGPAGLPARAAAPQATLGEKATGGAVAASNAAAAQERAQRAAAAQAAATPAAAPTPHAAAPAPRAASREVVALLWLDAARVKDIIESPKWEKLLSDADPEEPKKKPLPRPVSPDDDDDENDEDDDDDSLDDEDEEEAPAPEEPQEVKDRRKVLKVLSRGEPAGEAGIEAALLDAVTEDGVLEPPLVLVSGDLAFPFDELETLKATVAAAAPVASADKKLKDAVDAAAEALKGPGIPRATGLSEVHTSRIREAYAQAHRALPVGHLESQTERMLLEDRHYQKRSVLGQTWIRALLHQAGAQEPIPVYLPASLGQMLPIAQRIRARAVVEVHTQQDQYEPHPHALRALAVARVVHLGGPRREGTRAA